MRKSKMKNPSNNSIKSTTINERSNMKKQILLFPCLILAVLQGCTAVQGQVEALSISEGVTAKKYAITSGIKNVGDGDIVFAKNAKILKNILQYKGYSVTEKDSADAIILLYFGIEAPNIVYTGSKTTTEYNQLTDKLESQSVAEYKTSFTRYLDINAYDVKKSTSNNPIQLWKTSVVSTGSSSDLQDILPFLFVMSENYLNTNSNGRKAIEIYDNDERLSRIQNSSLPIVNSDTSSVNSGNDRNLQKKRKYGGL